MGYRTCYYRTFSVGYATPAQLDAYKQCREWLDAAIELVRPGVTTDQIAEVWPTAEEIGMRDEHAAFGLQFGHGLGVGLYEFPMISRLHSLDAPVELEVGMVFALETYCAADGRAFGGADRGGGRRHADRPRGDHALPGRGAARHRADVRARRRLRATATPPPSRSRSASARGDARRTAGCDHRRRPRPRARSLPRMLI